MDNVDKLESTSSKKIVYDFIKYGVNTLDQDQSKNFIYILPILSMRNIMSNITELWPQDHIHDKNLQDIFKNYVDLQLTPELAQTEELINTLPKEFHNLVMVGDRMRFVLSTYLTDDENVVSVRSDDLISLSIEELYNMVDNLTEDKVKVKSYFITEFIEHFYYTIIPLYSALNPSTRIVIPGVNADKNISTICKLIKDFSSVINMDLV
jgi:predicted DNA-binding protein